MSAFAWPAGLEAVALSVLDMPLPDHGAARRRAYRSVDAALEIWCALRVAERSCWRSEADGVPLEAIEERRARIEWLADRAWVRFRRRLEALEEAS